MYETDGHELSHYDASKKQRRGGKQTTDRRMDVVCLYCSTCDWIWNWDTFSFHLFLFLTSLSFARGLIIDGMWFWAFRG